LILIIIRFYSLLLRITKGDKICLANHAKSGYGTYVRDGYIYASLLGKAKLERELQDQSSDKSSSTSLPIVSIKTPKDNSVVIPHIGSLVIAKVKYLNKSWSLIKENYT
jgi:exosome complex RNA-binding protein Csl4